MRQKVLGVNVDVLGKQDTLEIILSWLRDDKSKKRQVVTAYSEFFVKARDDTEFMRVLNEADLVTPDGVSVLAAVRYARAVKHKGVVMKVFEGVRVGVEVLLSRVGETVTGVWLFENLCSKAREEKMKVFLLGGLDGVSARAARKLQKQFPGIDVEYDEGETRVGTEPAVHRVVMSKINRFRPDILFVAYSPVKQEKWIAKHKNDLKVGVAIGVGGTYDEYVGDLPGAPVWMGRSGLKWLWRLWLQPKRLGRIFRAVVLFPCLVFRESLSDK